MRGNTLSSVLVLAGALAGGVMASGCGENPVPLNPTYSQNIKPIMEAHCIRCHGAGGTLNADPDIPVVTNPKDPWYKYQGAPTNGYFTQLENVAPGRLGLYAYSVPGGSNILMKTALPFMPPPPADPLTDWERDTFNAWLQNPLP